MVRTYSEAGCKEGWQDKLLAQIWRCMAGLGRAGAMIWTVTRDSNTNLGVPFVVLLLFGEERKPDRREAWKDI